MKQSSRMASQRQPFSNSPAGLVYPHQLYERSPLFGRCSTLFLIEDPLFFCQFSFHKKKLLLHRASMKAYEEFLKGRGTQVRYVEFSELVWSGDIARLVQKEGFASCVAIDPCDDWLSQRLKQGCAVTSLPLEIVEDPHFLTGASSIAQFVEDKEKLFFTDFYIEQRKRFLILVQGHKPIGGKWSFDAENRKRLPKGQVVPPLTLPSPSRFVIDACQYVNRHFPANPGCTDNFAYPVTHDQSRIWLRDFIQHRLGLFGEYEDAISSTHTFVFHSVLTPALNCGLISPKDIVDAALAEQNSIPLNSLEGFIRQIIGWREYMRLVYLTLGRRQRTRNFWSSHRSLPRSFYSGSTGILPFDTSVQRAVQHGYCHHIERLMVLGNFMLLCDIDPDEVYRWFMELFIDAYDWVMVPNVYGMSQHADGGLTTTKPYISGSAYILKMSDYPKGPWCEVWDGLYWRFIDKNLEFFKSNPRMSVMAGMHARLGPKIQTHRKKADKFLSTL